MSINTRYRKISSNFELENNELFESIKPLEMMSAYQDIPVTWKRAENFSVYDSEDNCWIDMTSGIFVANSGHSNPYIKNAIKEQLDSDLSFAYNYPTEIKYRFVRKLIDTSPGYFDRTVLLSTGTEAVGAAYKMIKLWASGSKRKYIISFRGSYHGQMLCNHLIGGGEKRAEWSGVKDDNVVFLDFPYSENSVFDPSVLPPADQIAAVMIETFQGWGAWFYPESYIKNLCSYIKEVGGLICFDEMQAGFYRLGTLFGYMTYGEEIMPDIVCLGKGITSSLPLSAVITHGGVITSEDNADLHGTHSGNPLCCAAALANIEFLEKSEFQKDLRDKCRIFEEGMKNMCGGIVSKVNVRGMISALIFDSADSAGKVVRLCVERGILPVCTGRESIKFAPPLTIDREALLEALEVIRESIKDVC